LIYLLVKQQILYKLDLLFKYADDTNVIVPAYSDIALAQEFNHVKKWTEDNKMVIHLNKTKEIVFRRRGIRYLLAPAAVSGIGCYLSAESQF